ncbi:hypothetical protein [Oxalobacter formigenes]
MPILHKEDIKIAWQWLKVTTSYQRMIANPAQKAILYAIAKKLKKERLKNGI